MAQLVRRFSDADPTSKKSATQWLILTYISGGFLPEDLRDATIALYAVRNSGCALEHVDKSLLTFDLCRDAVKQDRAALRFVPPAFRDMQEKEAGEVDEARKWNDESSTTSGPGCPCSQDR